MYFSALFIAKAGMELIMHEREYNVRRRRKHQEKENRTRMRFGSVVWLKGRQKTGTHLISFFPGFRVPV